VLLVSGVHENRMRGKITIRISLIIQGIFKACK